MNWFIVIYFLINGSWIEADQLNKEGWSPSVQPNYETCIQKINNSNERFKKSSKVGRITNYKGTSWYPVYTRQIIFYAQ